MSSWSVIKPLPTRLVRHIAQKKQSLCQCLSSKEINLVPPIPVIGLLHAKHLFAKSSPKHSAQYGLSSRLVKRAPAKLVWQCVHVKHSLCHGSFLYVTPPLVITYKIIQFILYIRITEECLTVDISNTLDLFIYIDVTRKYRR